MVELNVAPGVHRVEDAYTNFFLVEDGDRLTIVDACTPASWGLLGDAVRQVGRTLDDVDALVLTHAHFDHVGFAERARTTLGIPVWVHEDDVPLVRHPLLYGRERSPLRYVANRAALPIYAELVRRRAFLAPGVKEVERYREGVLDVPGALRVVPTPGHTLGHCALHLPDRETVIAGDAVVTLDPYTGRRRPQVVSRAATADAARALDSLDALAATGARHVLVGHGPAWHDGAEAIVARARENGLT